MSEEPAPAAPVDALLSLLDLERIDRDIFRGANRGAVGAPGRVFGGQVAAQALRAATLTVTTEGHLVNSLHSYFLRPGRHGIPITYTVDRIRDGSSFTTRRVVALQDGEAILNLDASFHRSEPGSEWQLPFDVGDAAPPQDGRVPPPQGPTGRPSPQRRGFEMREVEVEGASRALWVRSAGPVPDDPALHACIVTFMSDMGPVGAVRRRTGGWGPQGGMSASLDHCLWFHRPPRADQWLLYRLEAIAAAGARGVARGEIWTADGTLLVSVLQEVLARPPKERPTVRP